jgi:hypothetical protein
MRKLGMEDSRGKKGQKKYMNKSSRHINGNKEGRKQKMAGGKENECTVRYKRLRPLATSFRPEIPRRVWSAKGLTSFSSDAARRRRRFYHFYSSLKLHVLFR